MQYKLVRFYDFLRAKRGCEDFIGQAKSKIVSLTWVRRNNRAEYPSKFSLAKRMRNRYIDR